MANNKKQTAKPMKGEEKEERPQHNPSKRKQDTMKVKGEDPDKKLEKGKVTEFQKRAH
ncbi:MAG: hypothetical protein H0V01_08005 [Bacteroidetes bacterium]|nr:hypothetical protein [Bacteroidota bacterium]HET6243474.1 hypothetical protein [Bacteroidia bacterium]